MLLSKTGFLEALPSLVGYARRRWDTAETDRLIALVEQVCKKLDEEKQRSKRDEEKQQSKADGEKQHSKPDVAYRVEDDNSLGHRGIPALGKEILELVSALQGT